MMVLCCHVDDVVDQQHVEYPNPTKQKTKLNDFIGKM